MSELVIRFHKVSKSYRLLREASLKGTATSVLRGKNVYKHFEALNNVSFEIQKGETVGIVGRNGAGKSTVLKLIAGVTDPTDGLVEVNEYVAPLIELGAGFHAELSGYENIFLNGAILGMYHHEVEKKLSQIIEFSELSEFIRQPVKQYSTGMYMRLAFSIAIHVDAPILLIDEVLAVGDSQFQEKCLKKLQSLKKEKEKTIVFISHDEQTVIHFCERAILLEKGNVVADGTPKSIFSTYHANNPL